MKRNTTFLILIAFVLVLTVPHLLFSHPHVFVANRFAIVFDEKGLAGIRVNWVFDKYFSGMIIDDYDKNRNGVFEATEVAGIKKEVFVNLADYGYFVFIKIDGNPFEVKFVRDFSARIIDGALVYEFLIPCHVRAISSFKEIRVSPYDPSYYTLVMFAEDQAVSIEGGARFEAHHTIKQNTDEAYYHGLVHPYEMILKFRLKSG